MPQIQVSTKEELNKTVYAICKVIQNVCQEYDANLAASLLPELVQSAAELVKSSYNFLD